MRRLGQVITSVMTAESVAETLRPGPQAVPATGRRTPAGSKLGEEADTGGVRLFLSVNYRTIVAQ